MKLTQAQKNTVIERVEYFVNKGNEIFNTDLGMPTVLFKKRGTTAGTAWYDKMELDFNAGLLVDNFEHFMNDTIPHEVAHLIDKHVYGHRRTYSGKRISHGQTWKSIMRQLGVDPERCHKMDTSKTAMPITKHIYVCEGCKQELVISQVRHNKLLRGRVKYYSHCRGTKLVFKETLGKISTSDAYDQNAAKKAAKAKTDTTAEAKKAPKTGSKLSVAFVVYKNAKAKVPSITRKELISLLVDSMNVTTSQATNLFQHCKKREVA